MQFHLLALLFGGIHPEGLINRASWVLLTSLITNGDIRSIRNLSEIDLIKSGVKYTKDMVSILDQY